ncbi:hypothetical protein KCP75_16800 [Salmonella enterica subsp. enterica]|nr:hypothetical protein KCP75_16800 [Salmonella enterica subsp. enterica]
MRCQVSPSGLRRRNRRSLIRPAARRPDKACNNRYASRSRDRLFIASQCVDLQNVSSPAAYPSSRCYADRLHR